MKNVEKISNIIDTYEIITDVEIRSFEIYKRRYDDAEFTVNDYEKHSFDGVEIIDYLKDYVKKHLVDEEFYKHRTFDLIPNIIFSKTDTFDDATPVYKQCNKYFINLTRFDEDFYEEIIFRLDLKTRTLD